MRSSIKNRLFAGLTWFLRRLLDPTKTSDLLVAVAFAASPALFAWIIGAHRTSTVSGYEFVGYWSSPNWLAYIVLMPLALFVLRWSMQRIAPVQDPWPPASCPEIITLVNAEGRETAYNELRQKILSPGNMLFALGAVMAFHAFDLWKIIALYVQNQTEVATVYERDWTLMFMASNTVGQGENMLLLFFAYALQFVMLLMSVLLVVLIFRHNLFFLKRTYQASRVKAGEEASYIVIDLDDVDRCFGFRRAHAAFNTQVLCLVVVGPGLLISRFVNVGEAQARAVYSISSLKSWGMLFDASYLRDLFPDFGQMILAFVWLCGFAAVSLPALVKLLPRIPHSTSKRGKRSIVSYLREFLPSEKWPYGDDPTVEEINAVAGRFSENAFWPTGDNRATQLFFFSFWVFLIILFPLLPLEGRTLSFVMFYVILGLLSMGGTTLVFQMLKWSLAYIDVRLVKSPAQVLQPPFGVGDTTAGQTSEAELRSESGAKRSRPRSLDSGSLLGVYKIDGLLGEGGMGCVYRATDTRLNRKVALKVLPEDFAQDPQRLTRFEHEAKALASLNHPNIATLYTFEQSDDLRYLVMELVKGETLADRLKEGALPPEEALRIGIEVAEALEQAHGRGIVHRDLKPGNIMLTETRSKLLDFGIAKDFQLDSEAEDETLERTATLPLTQAGTFLGTVHYMAPEQLEGKKIDPRTDVFSFGAVLYEMITSQKAFPGDSQATVVGAILHTQPPAISTFLPRVPGSLERFLERCLSKDPGERWQSSGELLWELKKIQAQVGRR